MFSGRVSLCSLGCPGIQSVDQGSLELRDPPVFASHTGIKFKFMTKTCFVFIQQEAVLSLKDSRPTMPKDAFLDSLI